MDHFWMRSFFSSISKAEILQQMFVSDRVSRSKLKNPFNKIHRNWETYIGQKTITISATMCTFDVVNKCEESRRERRFSNFRSFR